MTDEGSQAEPEPGPGVQAPPGLGAPPTAGALDVTRTQAVLREPVPSAPPSAPQSPAPHIAVPDALPPKAGADTPGTIPQTSAARVWGRAQLSNWRLYLVRALVAGLAVVLTVMLVPGLRYTGWGWGEFLRIAVIFGLLNAIIKPLLQFASLRFIFNTYGLVVVLINTVMLGLLGWLMPDQFHADRPVALLVGGLVVGVVGLVLETLLGANQPVLDRDYRERNGLA